MALDFEVAGLGADTREPASSSNVYWPDSQRQRDGAVDVEVAAELGRAGQVQFDGPLRTSLAGGVGGRVATGCFRCIRAAIGLPVALSTTSMWHFAVGVRGAARTRR